MPIWLSKETPIADDLAVSSNPATDSQDHTKRCTTHTHTHNRLGGMIHMRDPLSARTRASRPYCPLVVRESMRNTASRRERPRSSIPTIHSTSSWEAVS